MRVAGALGDLPLTVLSAGRFPPGEVEPAGFFAAMQTMQGELAARSTNGRHIVVADAGHYSLVLHPEGSQETSAAVRELLTAVR